MKKIIYIPHRIDDYVCMWNGLEDLYIQNTGEILPPKCFFSLSSFGSFLYMKTPKSNLKRIVSLSDGRPKQMYKFMAPIVGFDYKVYEYNTFKQVLNKIKNEIDAGFPCMIGALDMYYLHHFEKIYHNEHIPFHYELVVGYDDDSELIYFNDCGRLDTLSISYDELSLALDCHYPELSKKNTVWTFRINQMKNKYQIAKEVILKKKELFLNPRVGFTGYKGFCKFINELSKWKHELSKEEYDKILVNIVQFFGTVPTIPNALLGINKPDEVEYCGGFDKINVVLSSIGEEYNDINMQKVSKIFFKAAPIITQIKEVIVDHLIGNCNVTEKLPLLFTQVANTMKYGFETLK